MYTLESSHVWNLASPEDKESGIQNLESSIQYIAMDSFTMMAQLYIYMVIYLYINYVLNP